ncbi:hypothetical protein L1987_38077 [Smallanthus sonchifolius]|uniref:Uncharacterized protein n=1 Tax=Smallanthus sonchifolius TaxID=185202 RepID=A0ACB9HI81_9ASTR|nr:hypothetical protein L1987_38077 [Smallanthus sonchifolius]
MWWRDGLEMWLVCEIGEGRYNLEDRKSYGMPSQVLSRMHRQIVETWLAQMYANVIVNVTILDGMITSRVYQFPPLDARRSIISKFLQVATSMLPTPYPDKDSRKEVC